MIVYKPTSLLLALIMGQISIPLMLLSIMFILENACLHTHTMLKKTQIHKPLLENDNLTSSSAVVKYSNGVLTKKTKENPVTASEYPYLVSVTFILHHKYPYESF